MEKEQPLSHSNPQAISMTTERLAVLPEIDDQLHKLITIVNSDQPVLAADGASQCQRQKV